MGSRILVGLDGSTCSDVASEVAIQIAVSTRAELTGLHVLNVRAPSGHLLQDIPGALGFEPAIASPEVLASHERRGREILEAFSSRAAAAGLSVKTVCESDTVAHALHHHGNLAELVVIGRNGETEDRFPGQGGARVGTLLHQMTVPTLVVPKSTASIRSIALAYDGSDAAAHALAAVRAITEGLGVPVHAVFAGDEGFEVLDEVVESLPGRNVHRHVVPIDGDLPTVLANEAQQAGASLLAVGLTGKSRVHDFFFSSSADAIVANANLALLVAR